MLLNPLRRLTMKKLLAFAALSTSSAAAFCSTLVPVQLLNPAGSTAGQAIISAGSATAPAWGAVPLAGGGTGATSASAARTNLGLGTAAIVNTGVSGATVPLLNAANTWSASQTFSGISASGTLTGFSGRLLGIKVFTSGGTYTPTTGTAAVYVKVQAGGGAGGGTPATSAGQSAAGGGGAAGTYAEGYYTTGFSGVTITVGSAGAAASGANGGAGGSSSFGALLSCPGGAGGSVGTASTAWVTAGAAMTSAPTGTSLLYMRGQAGEQSVVISATASRSGAGGATAFGSGGPGLWSSSAGLAGVGFGSGGGGANASASTAAQTGSAGNPGIVEIFEFSQ